jgi:hypothetical protein
MALTTQWIYYVEIDCCWPLKPLLLVSILGYHVVLLSWLRMAPSFARSHLAISNHFQNLILTVCLFWSLQERFLGTLQSTPASTCSCKTSTVLSLLKPVNENICAEMAIFARGRNLDIALRPSWLSSISSYLWRRDCTVIEWTQTAPWTLLSDTYLLNPPRESIQKMSQMHLLVIMNSTWCCMAVKFFQLTNVVCQIHWLEPCMIRWPKNYD